MGTWGNLGKVNCGNSDVTPVLCSGIAVSYPPQAPRTIEPEMSTGATRSIAYAPNFLPFIDHVMILIIKDKMATSYLQFPYKASYFTSLCSYLVTETIQYYQTRGSNVFMLILDETKAFDRVKYSKLFNLLIARDTCPLIGRLLLNVYLISTAFVSWNGVNSDQFKLSNGVERGGV